MISVLNLGRCDYGTALRLQETLVDLRKQERIPNTLLFVEHPPVITLGRNAKEHNIVAPRPVLEKKGVEIFEINRGGDVTFHGPGQLVAYPIFDLRSFEPKLGAVEYVRKLEEVLIRISAQYGIETQRIKGKTGVWTFPAPPPRLTQRAKNRDYTHEENSVSAGNSTDVILSGGAQAPESKDPYCHDEFQERKIAAIGVHISRGVTSHGFALNVTTDLDFFKLIVPCGLMKPVSSIEFETGTKPTLDEVITHASRNFSEVFTSQVLWLDSLDDLLPEDVPVPNPEAPQDTPARAPGNLRQLVGDDTHLV